MSKIQGTVRGDFLTDTDGVYEIDALGGNDLIQVTPSLSNIQVLSGTIDGGSGKDGLGFIHASKVGPLKFIATRTGAKIGDRLTVKNIESFFVIGSKQNDTINLSEFVADPALRPSSLYGYSGADKLAGSAAIDYLEGGSGNDELIGNDGNDTLVGIFTGSDELVQFAPDAIANPGLGEVDQLTGGAGQDTFILADPALGIFYDDDNGTTPGTNDFAFIKDYSVAQNDVIQLKGAVSDYRFTRNISVKVNNVEYKGTGIYLRVPGSQRELIGLVGGTNSVAQVKAGLIFNNSDVFIP
jgi:Ca2+-binding RTX toxin-like protein